MYRHQKIALVIPAHNEQRLIGATLKGVPPSFDTIYVVDDGSTDKQNRVIEQIAEYDLRVKILIHERTLGPGAAIITGYRRALADGCDIAVVVGGDNQMDLSNVRDFLDPIIDRRVDYTKGNRFAKAVRKEAMQKMPIIRILANWGLTLLTRIASGNYTLLDVVDGYTAISRKALKTIGWEDAWQGYGYPMDFLIRLNACGLKVSDIPRRAIYLEGEKQSQIRAIQYAAKVLPMLLRGWRGRILQREGTLVNSFFSQET